MSKQKLEITWHNKDKALIPTTRGRYGYTWVDPTDPRYCQTNFLSTATWYAAYNNPSKRDEPTPSARTWTRKTTTCLSWASPAMFSNH